MGVRFPECAKDVFFSTIQHPDLIFYPSIFPSNENKRLYAEVKRPEREVDNSSNAEVKNAWSYTFIPPTC
jgi:hypothetical protein